MLRNTPDEYKNIPLKHLPVCGTSFEEVTKTGGSRWGLYPDRISLPYPYPFYLVPMKVTSYVHAVVKKVIPLEMFGSIENRAAILRGNPDLSLSKS
jgi:hypothetical protein